MTDRALGRMTMRRRFPRWPRRVQPGARVAVTYTAEQFVRILREENKRGRRDAEADRITLHQLNRLRSEGRIG